jgi:hypothetical protein
LTRRPVAARPIITQLSNRPVMHGKGSGPPKSQMPWCRQPYPKDVTPGSPVPKNYMTNYFLQPTFQMTCAMSLAVLTVSTTLPRMPPETKLSSSSSSYGMNMPLGVRRRPPMLCSVSFSFRVVTVVPSRRSWNARDGSQEMSFSSSSPSSKKFFEGSTGRSVS